ncbi:MAG: DUF2240 family protein [Candidatus Aenigmatarchaeota archaeon]
MNIDEIIQKIIEHTGLNKEEIDKKIIEKQKELSNLVSREGATYIIAKELGLELFPKVKRRLEIKNIIPKIRNLNLSARVIRVFGPKGFTTKEGRSGKVASIILGDSTGTIRLSLWDEQTHLAEKITPGMAIQIFNGYTRDDNLGGVEIRLSKSGGIKILESSDLPSIEKISKPTTQRKNIINLKEGDEAEVRAALVQLFETRVFYEICPHCGKRLITTNNTFKCNQHGNVDPSYAIVLSGVIDDGTENIRAVFFRTAALQLIGMNMEDALSKKDSLLEDIDVLGKEFILTGTVRRNKMFNRLEFVANSVREIDVTNEANKILNSLASNV